MKKHPSRSSAMALGLIAAILAGCTTPPPTTTTDAPTSTTVPSITATVLASPSVSTPVGNGDGMVLGLFVPPFAPSPLGLMSNAFEFRPPLRADVIVQLLYNGLYRYNESL